MRKKLDEALQAVRRTVCSRRDLRNRDNDMTACHPWLAQAGPGRYAGRAGSVFSPTASSSGAGGPYSVNAEHDRDSPVYRKKRWSNAELALQRAQSVLASSMDVRMARSHSQAAPLLQRLLPVARRILSSLLHHW